MAILQCLLLLMVANGAPVIARKVLGSHLAWPLDGGLHCRDGYALLGRSKTWRGVLAAILATALLGALLGLPWDMGALFGLYAMLGDALASFIKRRLGIPPMDRATGLDQFPEALLPLVLLREGLQLGWLEILLVATLFFTVDRLLSPLLFRLRIRQRPY